MTIVVAVDDPHLADVRALLEAHLAFCQKTSPAEHVHAFDLNAFVDPAVTLFSARQGSAVLGVGAINRLDEQHAELKSMHTAATARGQGIGRLMLHHLVEYAKINGFQRVSLETGATEEFAPARALYAGAGF